MDALGCFEYLLNLPPEVAVIYPAVPDVSAELVARQRSETCIDHASKEEVARSSGRFKGPAFCLGCRFFVSDPVLDGGSIQPGTRHLRVNHTSVNHTWFDRVPSRKRHTASNSSLLIEYFSTKPFTVGTERSLGTAPR